MCSCYVTGTHGTVYETEPKLVDYDLAWAYAESPSGGGRMRRQENRAWSLKQFFKRNGKRIAFFTCGIYLFHIVAPVEGE